MIMNMLSSMETAAAKVLRIVEAMKSTGLARAALTMTMLIVKLEGIARMVSGLDILRKHNCCSHILKCHIWIVYNILATY
jgi:hypothetical protein